MSFKFEAGKAKAEIEDIEVDEKFIDIYKMILLKAAKKFFGEHIEYNSDDVIVRGIILGEIRNMVRYGHAYCPCRIQKIREHICPCEPAKEEIRRNGICTCKLFIDPSIYKPKA
ncbi:MAG: ferredoxin-thioredoxin reductase catalytic domain-containing protein [Candidatus Korarchaeota archaeon]|nr:hypothetical protein [Thermoproteota archaeon]MCR8463435.1 hypothetical protein [Thermoproteota archaeon]MCR8471231.1 hypothetical protein [Thermoproteota archaeon]MCR8471924.1 hypothetical protein [Thermoproteota archaeon]MCR8473133.1 hypothetical protein [Thermoproteota archaeon]